MVSWVSRDVWAMGTDHRRWRIGQNQAAAPRNRIFSMAESQDLCHAPRAHFFLAGNQLAVEMYQGF